MVCGEEKTQGEWEVNSTISFMGKRIILREKKKKILKRDCLCTTLLGVSSWPLSGLHYLEAGSSD